MNKLIQDIAWGLSVEPDSPLDQMFRWAEIAGVDKLFAEPKRPEFLKVYYQKTLKEETSVYL